MSSNDYGIMGLWDVYGFGVTGLPVSWSSGLCSLLLETLLGMSCPETCWSLCGAWFQCRYGGI